ncbi:hypothetical protein TOI97_05965 [Denitrificimonas sp. JX-1]|uniref:Membrane protein implicated in regulation of membrane protease activity n=1 Tax=Denitrificimonas halotolerans TaxID=3098930 RepID=A0ABU5GQ85_9GAMM|nr:hypothetical protein [Denitrificimonas sp. JX-1]MDY7219113.1 hypothetical protein [Denitrificimonas sp. JX-1]
MVEQSLIWWVLVSLGIGLIIAELFVGTFVILWFGIGAILVGGLTFFVTDLNIGLQALLAVVSGGALMFALRRRYTTTRNAEPELMYTFSATEGRLHISQQGTVSVFANGTFWSIQNIDSIKPEACIEGATVSILEFRNNQAVIATDEGR